MPKEWILNGAINRWGLQKKKQVGAVSEAIRKCAPKNIKEWEEFYYKNVYPKKHLVEIGKKLYIKISEVLQAEIKDVTEEDCINYVINLIINRAYDGYVNEKETVYEQLQDMLGVKIEPAPDEWDRIFNVDFYIKVKESHIGLQIKPVGYAYITQIIKEQRLQKQTHEKFTKEYGGKVFYIYSIKENDKKVIHNKEVVEEIQKEINRLQNLS